MDLHRRKVRGDLLPPDVQGIAVGLPLRDLALPAVRDGGGLGGGGGLFLGLVQGLEHAPHPGQGLGDLGLGGI